MLPIKVLIVVFVWLTTLCTSQSDHIHSPDFVLCRHCGTSVASATRLVNRLTPAAESSRNDTLFGLSNVQVQTLVNPFNIHFNVISVLQATCIAGGQWQVEHSWYPGYAWKICTCNHCNHQLGWLFEPLATAATDRKSSSSKGFYALILDNLISEKYSDSLLATPKYAFHLRKHQEL